MERRDRPTKVLLSEVADRAGVSRALASLAIRGKPGVAQEKREKILQAAADLNYVANPAARVLASGESKTIDILVSNILNPFQAALTKAIDAAGRADGFEVLLSINGGTVSGGRKGNLKPHRSACCRTRLDRCATIDRRHRKD